MKGKYIAVGAGVCADLITIRGVNALRDADVILYDRLADETLLENVDAEKIFVGKTPYSHSITQEEINNILRERLKKGERVVRLKGGDSLIFSRVAEEIAVAKESGAQTEIVPGVTSASSAMARAGCPLTDRISASGVIFITGHCKDGEPEYNWKMMLDNGFTLAIYMGLKNINKIADNLMNNGADKNTPSLIADCVEQPDEKLISCTLESLSENSMKCRGPAVFIVGRTLKSVREKI
ncbi:MAG: uroporphyrinogen-III C-methyltransferase [Deferribacteraceae bacterium]|nr:uroporphyrinogen-III C-methyltransferase [Deferribacteraceae bacterium]